MRLYEIDARIDECFDPETGEILDMEALEKLEMEREAKITNVACAYKNYKAEADALKGEKMAFEKRQKAAEAKMESCKRFLDHAMGGMKFKNERCSISYRKSESVEVSENAINELPKQFIKVEKSIMKQALKDAIKGGQSFNGCRLVEHQNIQIK